MSTEDIITIERPLTYPRPTIKCPKCEKDTILCWGTKRKPYLRHKNSTCGSDKKSNGESALHLLAKRMLCEFLNNGNKVTFNTNCGNCKSKISEITAPSDKSWKLEYTLQNNSGSVRFDIAAVYENPIFGIEIYKTHRAISNTLRNIIPWVEVDAIDVLDKLDGFSGEIIFLTDIRSDRVCDNSDCKNSSMNVAAIACSSSTNNLSLNYSQFGNNIDNKDTFFNDLSNIQIARRFGYFRNVSVYNHEVESYLDEAIRGGYIPLVNRWSLETFKESDIIGSYNSETHSTFTAYNNMWAIFLNRGCCMKCNKKTNNIIYKLPYCEKCYIEIKKDDCDEIDNYKYLKKPEFDKIKIVSNRWKQLKHAFRFLNDINNVDKNELIICHLCKSRVNANLWWFGHYKQTCYDCALILMMNNYDKDNFRSQNHNKVRQPKNHANFSIW